MESISPQQLQQRLLQNDSIQLIDVREDFERDAFHIGGLHVPLSTIFEKAHLIEKEIPVVIYCQKGIRSQIAIQRLEARFGLSNLLNLQGGMHSWRSMNEQSK